ncbi:hypothetical protein D3C84_944640 [compost metagenome]
MAKEAPSLTPIMSGVARRLRIRVCTRQPERPMAAPATSTATMRGSRILNTVTSLSRLPSPSSVWMTPIMLILPEPRVSASRDNKIRAKMSPMVISQARRSSSRVRRPRRRQRVPVGRGGLGAAPVMASFMALFMGGHLI